MALQPGCIRGAAKSKSKLDKPINGYRRMDETARTLHGTALLAGGSGLRCGPAHQPLITTPMRESATLRTRAHRYSRVLRYSKEAGRVIASMAIMLAIILAPVSPLRGRADGPPPV